MKALTVKVLVPVLVSFMAVTGWSGVSRAEEKHDTHAMPAGVTKVMGTVKEVKVIECGIAPGSCKGTMVISREDGQESTVQIDYETKQFKKIKEADRYTLAAIMISQFQVGDKVKAETQPKGGGVWARAIVVQ